MVALARTKSDRQLDSVGLVTLVANLAGKVRRVSRNGRDYYVAPVTSIVPGVLNGSQGALYYPPAEIQANVGDWDNKPLTIYHPVRPDGSHASASEPGIWQRQGIGHIENSRYAGKLQHDAWFDIQRTRNADKRYGTDMIERLEQGRPIELSTGLYTENEPVRILDNFYPSFNGRQYDSIARNYRPDHLAILPNQTGACSVEDGCGVLVNTAARDDPQCPT